MEPGRARRLSELTASIRARQRPGADFGRMVWLLGKHAGGAGVAGAAIEAERFRPISPSLPGILTAAVSSGDPNVAGWASELAALQKIVAPILEDVQRMSAFGALAASAVRCPFLVKNIISTEPFDGVWAGPGVAVPLSRASFANSAALGPKKTVTLVPIAEELFASWSAAIEQSLIDSLTRALIFTADQYAFDPSIDVTSDRPASLTNGITPIAASGVTASAVVTDLRALLGGFSDFSKTVIVTSPAAALFLASLLSSNGDPIFPDMGAAGGEIWGVRVATSTGAVKSTSPAASWVTAVDCGRLIIADDGVLAVDVAMAGSLQFSDSPSSGPAAGISLFQSGARVVKLTRYMNFERASASAVAYYQAGY